MIIVVSFMTNQIIKHLLSNLKLYSIMQHLMILRWLMLKFWNFLKLPSSIYSLYGEESFDKIQNKVILTVSIKFIVDSDRFMVLFFSIRNNFVHLFYCWVLPWQWLVHSVVIISITFHNFFNTIFHWIRINSNPMVATKLFS